MIKVETVFNKKPLIYQKSSRIVRKFLAVKNVPEGPNFLRYLKTEVESSIKIENIV